MTSNPQPEFSIDVGFLKVVAKGGEAIQVLGQPVGWLLIAIAAVMIVFALLRLGRILPFK